MYESNLSTASEHFSLQTNLNVVVLAAMNLHLDR